MSIKKRNKIAITRLVDGWKYKSIADRYNVSLGTVKNCTEQYKANHPIWLKVRIAMNKLVN